MQRRLVGLCCSVAVTLSLLPGCKSEDKQQPAKQKAATERAEQQAAAEQATVAGKQALDRWAARMKSIRAQLPGTAGLKSGCEDLKAPAPLETVDSALLDAIQSSPTGSVTTQAAAGYPSLQSNTVRTLFYEIFALGAPNWSKVSQIGNQLDAATQLAVFMVSETEQPSLVTQDSFTGGAMKGALVVFDLSTSSAVCRIPLKVEAPTKTQIEAESGKLEVTGPDLLKRVLEATALALRKKAVAALGKLGNGVTLAEPFRP
jgi:hypothetical protein